MIVGRQGLTLAFLAFLSSIGGPVLVIKSLRANAGEAVKEAHLPRQASEKEKTVATTQSKFFCNTRALTAAERARHAQLGEKMDAARKAVVETEKGYEFQYTPGRISIGELAEWVAEESKCCPFFDFHIDLEEHGHLLCLRLTGEEGVKAFIRAEFSEAWPAPQR